MQLFNYNPTDCITQVLFDTYILSNVNQAIAITRNLPKPIKLAQLKFFRKTSAPNTIHCMIASLSHVEQFFLVVCKLMINFLYCLK